MLRGTFLVIFLAVRALVARGTMSVCLIILMLAPILAVAGYESHGHRDHIAELQLINVESDTRPQNILPERNAGKGNVLGVTIFRTGEIRELSKATWN